MFDLSASQTAAAVAIKDWFEEQEAILVSSTPHDGEGDDFTVGEPQAKMSQHIFRLFGYAGTGKTTTIRAVMEILGIRNGTHFAAYTGKAAMVMRKTGLPATTIHSMIYKPVPPNEQECRKISKMLSEETDKEKKQALKIELKEKSKIHFALRDKKNSVLNNARLIVLDECSMVNDDMLIDLKSFNVPILVLGDPGQLPPIDGEGALTREKPDVMLTEIHRQARGNPIIDFATRARNGIFIPKIQLGTSRHVSHGTLQDAEVLAFEQIICGKNATRFNLNRKIRELKGVNGIYPNIGEKLICTKNNAEEYLFNGLMCEVMEVGEMLDTAIQLKIKRETDPVDSEGDWFDVLRAPFEQYVDKEAMENLRWWDRKGNEEFDFAYAITAHKAQGSQFDTVLIWDDGLFKGWKPQDRKRWLYTSITRAISSVTISS